MHPQPNDRVFGRHGQTYPELQPGQIVTWKDVVENPMRAPRPRQGSLFPHRRSPDRQRSLERRRRLAASGPMPPQLAARFTTGQLSVLRIVGDEVRQRGRCVLFLDEIAARAGVSRRLAQAALRWAEERGLVRIVERPLGPCWNDSNLVTIINPEWLAWLRLKARTSYLSAKNFRARTVSDSKPDAPCGEGPKKESAGVGFAKAVPRSPP